MTDDAVVALCVRHPDLPPAELAERLDLSLSRFLAVRHKPTVATRIDAELNKLTFAPALRAAAEQATRSVAALVAVRDAADVSPRDRTAAAKALVEVALKLDQRQRELDGTARMTAQIDAMTNPPGPSLPVERSPIELPPAAPVPPIEHPPISQLAPEVAARLLRMREGFTPDETP